MAQARVMTETESALTGSAPLRERWCTQAPEKVRGVQLMNISLRQLHLSKQNPVARPFVAALQKFLRESQAGAFFFNNLASPASIQSVLRQAYCNPDAVTDELVDCILKPGFEEGAVDVFLDFIRCAAPCVCFFRGLAALVCIGTLLLGMCMKTPLLCDRMLACVFQQCFASTPWVALQ